MNEYGAVLEYSGIDGDRTVAFTIVTDLVFEAVVQKYTSALAYEKWISVDLGTGVLILPTGDVKSLTINRPVPTP